MKQLLKFAIIILIIGIIIFASCKKEYSCESCNQTGSTNKPPIAVAGPDQTITLPTDSVLLDGNASSDPDGIISSFLWTKISGPASFNILSVSVAKTVAKNLLTGIYQFELKVTDDGGLSARDTISVFVNPANSNSIGCNITMETVAHLPTPGVVRYAVSVGTKLLFTRGTGNGVVDIYDTLTHTWETATGMYATSPYLPEQDAYKTAKVGSKIIFSISMNPQNPAQGQLINIYDAASNSWSIDHLSQAREFYSMAVAGNKVFYAGGNTDSKKMDVYDATANSWSIADFNEARNGMVAESIGNKIYFAGGIVTRYDSLVWTCDDYGNNCDSVPAFVGSDRVDILDVSTNTWSLAHLSEGRWFMAHAIVGNKIVFAGGESPGNYSSKVDIYDAATNTWSSTDLGQAIGNEEVYGAYTAGSKLLVPNGFDNDKIHVYDAVTNTWSIAQMPFHHQSDMFERNLVTSAGNKIVFLIQFNNNYPYNSRGLDIYDAALNTWCHTQLSFDLMRTGMTAIGNRIYVGGGYTSSSIYNSWDTPLDNIWILHY